MRIKIACSGAFFVLIALTLWPHSVAAALTADLKFGSRGAQVSELQDFLIAKGLLTPPATGNFFALTKKAVITYQESMGLPGTGFVGPLTRTAIAIEIASRTRTTNGVSATSTTAQLPAPQATAAPQVLPFNPAWKDAVVNLFCTNRYGGSDDMTSGSGVIIDPRGIILTNAHVALSFLFADWPTPSLYQCSVRIGSPATATYTAKLLYIPEPWMKDTMAGLYSADDHTVYGAHDYALLVITGRTNDTATLPAAFPYAPAALSSEPVAKAPVYLIGYAASFLGGVIAQKNLFQLASPAAVHEVKSIGTNTTRDILSFVGNIAGQHGSSGGAVMSDGGVLAGLITFFDSDYGYATSDRVVNAITTSYIHRDLQELTGSGLTQFLHNADIRSAAEEFMRTKGAEYHAEYIRLWREKQGATPPGVY